MERALSFGTVADDYDRLRPSPPQEAVEWLLPPGASTVVDLGAGTGAMTRRLAAVVDEVIAVEPDDRMREVLARRSPDTRALAGRGDLIPLPDDAVDAVIVSSAWHWMDPATTLPEIARVLHNGGRLGVIWTNRDFSVDWLREIAHEVMPSERSEQERRDRRQLHLTDDAPFTEPEEQRFRFNQTVRLADAAASFATYSAVIAMGAAASADIVVKAERLFREHFGDVEAIDLPMASLAIRTNRTSRD